MADMAGGEERTIYILDDDASVRKALARLFRSAGMAAKSFASVDELLSAPMLPQCVCIVADIRMQGTSGLAMPGLLAERGLHNTPVIFVSAQDTEETRAAAKRAGAAGFFRKPVDDQALLDALAWAMRSDNHKNHA